MFGKEFLAKYKIVDFGYTENPIPIHFNNYKNWVEKKSHLPLNYLSDHRFSLRKNIREFYPEFQSALVFLFSYYPEKKWLEDFYLSNKSNGLKIASYTMGFGGKDYHSELRQILELIGKSIQEKEIGLNFQLCLDVHPVLERDLAFRAGLGFQGKNSMFISKKHGSFTIIGSLLLNKKLNIAEGKLDTDHCGQCTRCIDNCPTSAIDPESRTIISKDCISTFTIEEFKLETIPSEKMNLNSGYVFGCDICQNVCPWNLKLERNNKIEKVAFNQDQLNLVNYLLVPQVTELQKSIEALSNKDYLQKFKNTSFERSGKRGVLKNLIFYLKNKR